MSQQNLTIFKTQWQTYQQVVECNFMAHQQIQARLHTELAAMTEPFSLLDLGCGDSAVMLDVLKNTKIDHYHGVDLSEAALDFAVKNAQAEKMNADFSIGDLKNFSTAVNNQCFDVIVAGFSLHHLQAEEKQQFFHDCKKHLNKGGRLVIYDVVRRQEENRETYLARYCGNIEKSWNGLSKEAIALILEHINSSDYPQSLQELETMTNQAGFDTFTVAYKDSSEFHQLLLIDGKQS